MKRFVTPGTSQRSPEASDSCIIPALRASIAERLEALDRERDALQVAMHALDGTSSRRGDPLTRAARREPPPALSALVAEALRADPGVRASVLALTLRRPVEQVRELLETMERDGSACRDGLGWRIR